MSVRSPDPKQCPNCKGMLYWIINSQNLKPNEPLTEKNRALVWMGYVCRGEDVFGIGCGYAEEYTKDNEFVPHFPS